MGVTYPKSRAFEPEDDHAIVLEAIDFMMKIETLTEEQRDRLKDIKAVVDRRQE
jgi:hypothetical protein